MCSAVECNPCLYTSYKVKQKLTSAGRRPVFRRLYAGYRKLNIALYACACEGPLGHFTQKAIPWAMHMVVTE